MDPEIASCVLKFQNLSCAGKNAELYLSSDAGKVSVNLSFEIGAVKPISEFLPVSSTPCPVIPNSHRMSPSRRTQRRMYTRKLFAEEATKDLSVEEKEVLKAAEEAENKGISELES